MMTEYQIKEASDFFDDLILDYRAIVQIYSLICKAILIPTHLNL